MRMLATSGGAAASLARARLGRRPVNRPSGRLTGRRNRRTMAVTVHAPSVAVPRGIAQHRLQERPVPTEAEPRGRSPTGQSRAAQPTAVSAHVAASRARRGMAWPALQGPDDVEEGHPSVSGCPSCRLAALVAQRRRPVIGAVLFGKQGDRAGQRIAGAGHQAIGGVGVRRTASSSVEARRVLGGRASDGSHIQSRGPPFCPQLCLGSCPEKENSRART